MGDMPSTSLSAVGGLLRTRGDAFRDEVHRLFYMDVLEARQVFPIQLHDTHVDLAASLAWVLERTPLDGVVPDRILRRIRQLGLDHRRHGFPAEAYPAFLRALRHGLREIAGGERTRTDPGIEAAENAFAQVCATMAEAAREADTVGVPHAYAAEVLSVERRSRRISVVRLESGMPLNYAPGQHLPVTTSYLPGIWRMLSPALPADEHGQLEFHIRSHDGGKASPLLSSPHPGDYWTFGNPQGSLQITGERDVVMIAHGTGLAPLRSILFALFGEADRPRVHLFVGAEYPGELYDLRGLMNLADTTAWLTVTPVAEHAEDAWWVGATDFSRAPGSPAPRVAGNIATVVTSLGEWTDHDILITGAAEKVSRTVTGLITAGIPRRNIQAEPWGIRAQWPEIGVRWRGTP